MTEQEIELRTVKEDIREIKELIEQMNEYIKVIDKNRTMMPDITENLNLEIETIPQTQACNIEQDNLQGVITLKL